MLPIRFIVEEMGGTVEWFAEQQMAVITLGDTTIRLTIGEQYAFVNDMPTALDAPAFIENGRTYLPLRFVMENLDATVQWDAAARTVKIIPA